MVFEESSTSTPPSTVLMSTVRPDQPCDQSMNWKPGEGIEQGEDQRILGLILGGVFVLHQFEVGRLSQSFIGEKNVPRGAGIPNHQPYVFSILHHQHCLWKFHSGMASSLGPNKHGPQVEGETRGFKEPTSSRLAQDLDQK